MPPRPGELGRLVATGGRRHVAITVVPLPEAVLAATPADTTSAYARGLRRTVAGFRPVSQGALRLGDRPAYALGFRGERVVGRDVLASPRLVVRLRRDAGRLTDRDKDVLGAARAAVASFAPGAPAR